MARRAARSLRRTALGLAAALAVVAGAGSSPAAPVTVTGTIVHDSYSYTDPRPLVGGPRCKVGWYVEFDQVPGATSAVATLDHASYGNGLEYPAIGEPPWDTTTFSAGGERVERHAPPGKSWIPLDGFDRPGLDSCAATIAETQGRWTLRSLRVDVDNTPPVAAFTWQVSPTDPLTVDVDGSSSTDDKGVASYAWDFDDGAKATGQTARHSFDEPGTYDVELTVTDAEGLDDATSLAVTVGSANEKPQAFFTSRRRDGAPLTVDLDASGSSDDHGIVDYAWSFPDGGAASGPAPSHTFVEPGTYQVRLTVTDEEGLSDAIELPVEAGSSCDGTGSPTGETSFRLRVLNRDGRPVRNVRVEAYDPCGGATELSDPTDRTGVALLTMPYVQEDGADPVIVLTPKPDGHFAPFNVVYTEGGAVATVEFTATDTCFQHPVTVLGTEQSDTLELLSGDVLSALGGADAVTDAPQAQGLTVCGGDGGDTITITNTVSIGDQVDGGGGQDVIATGNGPDTVLGGDDGDRIVAGADDDLLYGGEGDDELRAGAGCDGLAGDIGNDTLDGGGGVNTVPLYGGCPTGGIDGGPGDDVIVGGGQADLAAGGPGCDSMLGGPGDDRLFGGADADASSACPGGGLDGGGGDDVLDGADGNDELHAGGGDDTVLGGAGDDRLFGDGGCDAVEGHTGNDVIVGGAGPDGPDAIGGCAEGKLDGGAGLDTIDGEGGNDLLLGGDACDRLVGGAGGDTIDGGEAAEAPSGCSGGTIDGGGGADTIYGGGGADLIGGGDGADTISGDGGYGGTGSLVNGGDRIFGDDGVDTIFGGDEDDDACRSGDYIDGGGQRDIVFGGDGGDVLVGADGNDDLRGGAGCDDIYGGPGKDTIEGEDNPTGTIELLWGEADNDTVRGGDGADAVYGGAGKDSLEGGPGDDILDGGVTGSPGPFGSVPPDEFAAASPRDSVVGGPQDTTDGDRCALRQQLDSLVGCEREEFVQNNARWAEFTLRPRP